ncbi:DUF5672 family protein [Paraburkholderia heleia]|uniref:DUF5672 family protein n=1 Tax=Paraburkholderia heleia TaxID=634127 RepID=UPI002AB75394|nr:DUF5672 family protein [Paraburkholderia heleia]
MSDFSRITVVSVTGLQAVASGALSAIELSMRQLSGSRGLLLSPAQPEGMMKNVRHVAIKPFGYMEYSLFVLYSLGQFIDTEFALIVQNDGWAVDVSNWRPEFFDYDYLGAPVHLARVHRHDGAVYRGGFSWVEDFVKGAPVENIFNGGFSLRSKKLLNAPRALGIPFQIPVPSVSATAPHAMQWDGEAVLEDVWLCISARQQLERAGMKFPSLDIARQFSIEHAAPVLHGEDSVRHIFGHHSKLRKIVDENRRIIRYDIPQPIAESIYGEKWIMDWFRDVGYSIHWPMQG